MLLVEPEDAEIISIWNGQHQLIFSTLTVLLPIVSNERFNNTLLSGALYDSVKKDAVFCPSLAHTHVWRFSLDPGTNDAVPFGNNTAGLPIVDLGYAIHRPSFHNVCHTQLCGAARGL